jgi:chromosome segregation ATPase
MQSELTFLRNQNKILNDEISALRKIRGEIKPSPIKGRARSAGIDRSSPGKRTLPPPVATASSLTPRKTSKTPGTPVSGLVATFESRIYNTLSPDAKQQCHEKENDDNSDFKEQLRRERDQVKVLQKKLRAEQELVSDLKKQLIARRDSREQSKLAKFEKTQSRKQHVSEREEIENLRSEILSYHGQKEDYEKTIQENKKEIEQLKVRLHGLSELSKQKDGNKEIGSTQSIAELKERITEKDRDLEKMRSKCCSLEQEKNAAQDRLTLQVKALQSELEAATLEIESLQNEIERTAEDSGREKTQLEEALANIELELTMNKARQAEIEVEYASKIQTLEEQILCLESANKNLSMEVHAEKEKDFEEKTAKLTSELLNAQMKMADQEMLFSLKVNNLENQIQSLNAQLENANKRIADLLKELEERQSSLQNAENLVAESAKEYEEKICRLNEELTKTKKGKAEFERDNAAVLASLENQLEALENQAELEVRDRDDQISKLKKELVEKEEEITRLEQTKTDLRSNLAESSASKQDEVRRLESELLDLTNRTIVQAREIESLKMEVQERDLRKQDSCVVHQRRIQDLEDEILELKQSGKNQSERDAFAKVQAENVKLRESIREVKSDRRALQEKLNSLLEERSSSRSAQVLRERNQALKHEVEKLTKRLRKMEASITRFAI